MRIAFLTSELAPLAQSGGLGEAVRGLALELVRRGHELSVCMPGHRRALRSPVLPPLQEGPALQLDLGGRPLGMRWGFGRMDEGPRVALLECPELFDRDGLYGDERGAYPDEGLRFVAFARAAAELCAAERPDVVVAHDWHAALAPCLLAERHGAREVATVQVVHNAAYQGLLPAAELPSLGLPASVFSPAGLEYWGKISLLKAGIAWAQRVVAVSPGYARELVSTPFGMGLEGVFAARGSALLGIPNGIDVERYDPAADEALPARFSARDARGKARCREAALEELGLARPDPGRFAVAIGRLAAQKGWDVLAEAADELVARGTSLALIGDGDEALAESLRALASRHPRRVHASIGWDEALSRRLYAAADLVLVPSRFEPCGLVQLIAQRYGAWPVAHATGGLVDTIVDGESGTLFRPLTARALVQGVERAASLFAERGAPSLVRALLALDVSWREPAERWEALFDDVVAETRAR